MIIFNLLRAGRLLQSLLVAALLLIRLVVSGGWRKAPALAQAVTGKAFGVVCDVLAKRMGAQRAVFEEANHNPHNMTPKLFNARLRAFLESA